VAAGAHASLGPLAAAYVLILAVVAPLAARAVGPLVRRAARPARTLTSPGGGGVARAADE
jgi:CPA2 family monovalent cation:H+ antiporter-2